MMPKRERGDCEQHIKTNERQSCQEHVQTDHGWRDSCWPLRAYLGVQVCRIQPWRHVQSPVCATYHICLITEVLTIRIRCCRPGKRCRSIARKPIHAVNAGEYINSMHQSQRGKAKTLAAGSVLAKKPTSFGFVGYLWTRACKYEIENPNAKRKITKIRRMPTWWRWFPGC